MQSQKYQANSKRVAKNTLLLYFRMILLLIIGLVTSRVVLQVLGIDNYGINNVVAGFLSMFGIITSSMSTAISRFITVELGRGNQTRLKDVFSTSMVVQFTMGVLLIVLIESVGMWFLESQMNIPNGREDAAKWCLHCAAFITFVSLLNVPFNSAIVAHEKMSAFAYMSILEAILKLLICYAIYITPFDRLKTYAFLGAVVSSLVTLIYWVYSYHNFKECSFKLRFRKSLFKEIWGFAGWNFFGQAAWILNTQGINMLMNIFFGVVVNAARGIVVQVNGILQQFVNNFMIALNPQITKSYAAGDKEYAFLLACRGARFSFYIMYVMALPIMLEAHQILELWLGTPPANADVFLVWTILSTFTTLVGSTLVTLQMAHGHIRNYQIWITILGCLPFPLSWLLFKLGYSAVSSYIVFSIVYWVLIFVRFYLVQRMVGMPAQMYLKGVVLRCHVVAIVSALIPFILFLNMNPSLWRLLIVTSVSIVISIIVIYSIGMETSEKQLVKNQLIKQLIKIRN